MHEVQEQKIHFHEIRYWGFYFGSFSWDIYEILSNHLNFNSDWTIFILINSSISNQNYLDSIG
jgi:hypothetical protein